MAGRPPKPRELKVLDGNPGKRSLPAEVVVAPKLAMVPAAPADLTGHALQAWGDLAPILTAANLLDETNLVTLRGLCVQIDVAMRARDQIARCDEPLVLMTERGSYIENPIYAIERRSWQMVLRYAVEFGLTPSARAKLGLNVALGLTLAQDLHKAMDDDAGRADVVLPDLDA